MSQEMTPADSRTFSRNPFGVGLLLSAYSSGKSEPIFSRHRLEDPEEVGLLNEKDQFVHHKLVFFLGGKSFFATLDLYYMQEYCQTSRMDKLYR